MNGRQPPSLGELLRQGIEMQALLENRELSRLHVSFDMIAVRLVQTTMGLPPAHLTYPKEEVWSKFTWFKDRLVNEHATRLGYPGGGDDLPGAAGGTGGSGESGPDSGEPSGPDAEHVGPDNRHPAHPDTGEASRPVPSDAFGQSSAGQNWQG